MHVEYTEPYLVAAPRETGRIAPSLQGCDVYVARAARDRPLWAWEKQDSEAQWIHGGAGNRYALRGHSLDGSLLRSCDLSLHCPREVIGERWAGVGVVAAGRPSHENAASV